MLEYALGLPNGAEDYAATQIQTVFRGRQSRKQVQQRRQAREAAEAVARRQDAEAAAAEAKSRSALLTEMTGLATMNGAQAGIQLQAPGQAMAQWSVGQVGQWLTSVLGLPSHYATSFGSEFVDGATLLEFCACHYSSTTS